MINIKGNFIVFEGLDFSGKSSLIDNIISKVKTSRVIKTKEPSDVSLVKCCNDNKITETLLFAADRSTHVSYIKSLIDEGYTVICDRYVYSSMFYQGHLDKVGIERVKEINDFAMDELKPDLVIYVYCSESDRDKRAAERGVYDEKDDQVMLSNHLESNLIYFSIIDAPKCLLENPNHKTVSNVADEAIKMINKTGIILR